MSLFQKILFTVSLLFGIFSLVDIIVPTKFQESKIIDNQTQLIIRKHNSSDYRYYFQITNKKILIDYEQYEIFNTIKDSTIFVNETFLFKNIKAYNYHGYTSYTFSLLSCFLMPILLVIFSILGFIVKEESRKDNLIILVTMLLTLTIFIKFL